MSVDELRAQLRERGYLTHGIERWFALDPWSSRTFWRELAALALKAAVLVGGFGALPLTAIMLFRNHPLGAAETLALFASYAASWTAAAFLLVVGMALVLKLRPALPIDTPRALLAISLAAGALLVLPVIAWWWRFDSPPETAELLTGGLLSIACFLVSSIVVSAALLSFSIYESKRIPAIHQRPRTLPLAIGGAVLVGLLFVPAQAGRERADAQPMVVVSPTSARIALIAVDGLTHEIFRSRPALAGSLAHSFEVPPLPGSSTTERWASLGTGVRTEAHRVRAIEGIRFAGGTHVLQRISAGDLVLLRLAPLVRLARREPLPPTVRKRDYAWEIVASRGLPAVSVNWWATGDWRAGALHSTGPEGIFAKAGGDPIALDTLAEGRFTSAIRRESPRFATVYLPALDVILNRLESDEATRLARSLRALDGIERTVSEARAQGFDVIVVGLPGEQQGGAAVVASSFPLRRPESAWDIAPTLLDLLGFPLSEEMPGTSRAGGPQPRIASYGQRAATGAASPEINQEYYDTLRSLGYIR